MLLDVAEHQGKGLCKMQKEKGEAKSPPLMGAKMLAKDQNLQRALDVKGKVWVSCRDAALLRL